MDNFNLKNLLREKLFCDCIIKYDCIDKTNEIKSHRILIATLPYFNSLFKNTKLEKKEYDDEEYYIIKIVIPIYEQTFLLIIDELYDNFSSGSNYIITDLINGMYFFGFDFHIIKKYWIKNE